MRRCFVLRITVMLTDFVDQFLSDISAFRLLFLYTLVNGNGVRLCDMVLRR